MVTEVRQEINYSKYLKISQSILDKCINALGVYTEEDLQIRKEILNSISEIWAIFNETLPDNFFEIFPPSVSSIIILVKLCTLIFNNTEREVDAENKLEACKLLDKHVELLNPSHRERSINLSIELKTQTLISGLIINEDINEIIEQIFTFSEIFNEKNRLRIEEIYIQNDLITLRKKFPFELFEIDFISYIIYFINNYSEIFPDQKKEQLGKIEWNHNASDEIKYRLKYGHPRKEVEKDNIEEKKLENKKDSEDKTDETETQEPTKKRRTRKRKGENGDDTGKTTKAKTTKRKSKKSEEKDDTEISKSTESSASTSDEIKQEFKTEIEGEEVVKQKRHTKKRWNETQEKFLEECIRENNFVIDPKKFYAEHGPNGTKSHNLGEFTVNNIRDKCKSEKRKRIKMNMNLGVYEDSINNSFHIQMEIKNELVNNKRVPNCRRRRWTEEQLKCLEKCILESNGNIYPSLILNLHGPNGIQSNILGNQTRQSIHDKCKNEKWKRIQQGLPLGAFEKAAKKSISSIGNKWRNTKVLKEYVASSEGKRRKRNVDPYYKAEHQKKSKKVKSDGSEESGSVNDSNSTSNVTSQSQVLGETSSTYDFNNYNNESSTSSFIHINEASQNINANPTNFNNIITNPTYDQNDRNNATFPFIPANDQAMGAATNENNSDVYIKANVNTTSLYDSSKNTASFEDKTKDSNIPNKADFGTDNPFQFNEKEATADYIFQQNESERKINETDPKIDFTNFENKNDENNNKNNLNNSTEIKMNSSKVATETEFFENKPVAATVIFSKEASN